MIDFKRGVFVRRAFVQKTLYIHISISSTYITFLWCKDDVKEPLRCGNRSSPPSTTAIRFKILDMSQPIGRGADALIYSPNRHRQPSSRYRGADVRVFNKAQYAVLLFVLVMRRLELALPHSSSANSSHMTTPAGSCLLQTPPWRHVVVMPTVAVDVLYLPVAKACRSYCDRGKNNNMRLRIRCFIMVESLWGKLLLTVDRDEIWRHIHNSDDA